jgi:lysozyme family protein
MKTILRHKRIMDWPTSNSEIIDLVLANEGGYINNPSDKGGSTNYGITIDTLSAWRHRPCTDQDVRDMPVSEARDIYTCKYIITPNFDKIQDIRLRAALVDYGVLFGPLRATQSLQAVLKMPQDGILGANTLAAANGGDWRFIINQLSCARISYHADRVTKDHTQIVFLKGWLSRAMSYIT